MFLQFCCFVLCLLLRLGQTLDLAGTQEGSCRTTVNSPGHPDVDPVWLDSLPYVIAGSKFHMYRTARGSPRFAQLREYEFYYEACFVKNTSIIEGNGSIFGFGGVPVASYDFQPSSDTNALVDAFPSNQQTGSRSDFVRQRVSFTDYRTFAVMVNCWVGADEKSWDVYSIVPRLDTATEQLIQDHIQSLGFSRKNVVFLRYENCQNLQAATVQGRTSQRSSSTIGTGTDERGLAKTMKSGKQSPVEATRRRLSVKPTLSDLSSQNDEGSNQMGSIKRGIPSGGANTLKLPGKSSTRPAPTKRTTTTSTTTTTTTTSTSAPPTFGGFGKSAGTGWAKP